MPEQNKSHVVDGGTNKSLVKFCSNWFCQNCSMDFFKLLDGFFKIDILFDIWIVTGFVKVATGICQSCSMYFLPFAKQNQLEV